MQRGFTGKLQTISTVGDEVVRAFVPRVRPARGIARGPLVSLRIRCRCLDRSLSHDCLLSASRADRLPNKGTGPAGGCRKAAGDGCVRGDV